MLHGVFRPVCRASLVWLVLIAVAAFADTVPFGGAPLAIHVGERGQLQAIGVDNVNQTGIFYPPASTSGDAGFFLAFPTGTPPELAGAVYGFFGGAGPHLATEYTPLTQSPVTGSGTAADPLTQVTTYAVHPDASDLLVITQTTRYVNGSQEFTVHWSVANGTGAPLAFKALAAGDFFFDGSDRGTGIFTAGPPRFIGGTNADTGASGGFVEVVTGSPPWSAYEALAFGADPDQVWGKIAAAATSSTATFDDSVVGEPVDNAGGVEWDQYVAAPLGAGAVATFELIVRSAVPSALQMNPTNAGAPRGTPITFTATAIDTVGMPYAGRTLRYDIVGANPSSGAVTLDATGSGQVVDPGTNAGDDTLIAYVDFNQNATRESAEPQASALATFVDDVAPTCMVSVSGDRPGGGGAGKPLVIMVDCDETTTVTATTTLETVRAAGASATIEPEARGGGKKRHGKQINLPPTTATAGPGEAVPVDVTIPTSVAKKYSGKTLKATVTVVATDPSGNVAQTTVERVVKLAKFRKKKH